MGARAEGEDARLRRARLGVMLGIGALTVGALVVWLVARPASVEVARVIRGDLVRTVVTSGRVEAPARTWLSAEIGGRVVAVEVDEGSHVEAGELLVQLDDDQARDALTEVKAALAEAEARLARERGTGLRVRLASEARALAEFEQAERHYARTAELVEAGALATEALDEARRRRETAEAELRRARAETESVSAGGSDVRLLVAAARRAQAAVQSAERRVAEMALRAPSPGAILAREVELGQVVSTGQRLLEFVADGAPRLEVHPDEIHLATMREGQKAVASLEAAPDSRFEAHVSRIAPAVDAARGTVKIELAIEPPLPELLRTGMTVSVEIELARREGALIVPAEAVDDPAGGAPSVLVVEGGRATRRQIALGMRAGDRFELRDGLDEGELVIVDGHVDDGARVRPVKGP